MSEVFKQMKLALGRAQQSGMALSWIAREAGISPQTINTWLDGKIREPRLTSLLGIADVLGKRIEMVDGVYHLVPAPKDTGKRREKRRENRLSAR